MALLVNAFEERAGLGQGNLSASAIFAGSKRCLQICLAHRCGPYSTDDDSLSSDRVDNLPSPIDQLVPAAFAKFVEERSSFGVLDQNLRALVNTRADF